MKGNYIFETFLFLAILPRRSEIISEVETAVSDCRLVEKEACPSLIGQSATSSVVPPQTIPNSAAILSLERELAGVKEECRSPSPLPLPMGVPGIRAEEFFNDQTGGDGLDGQVLDADSNVSCSNVKKCFKRQF